MDVEKVIQQKKRNSFEFPDSLHMVKKLVKHKKAKKLRKNIKKYKKKEV